MLFWHTDTVKFSNTREIVNYTLNNGIVYKPNLISLSLTLSNYAVSLALSGISERALAMPGDLLTQINNSNIQPVPLNCTSVLNMKNCLLNLTSAGEGKEVCFVSTVEKEGKPSRRCVFPFSFRGKSYVDCTADEVSFCFITKT